MTEEQKEACEKLANEWLMSLPEYKRYSVPEDDFKYGFQAAQSPEMLMLNPKVKGLVEALERSIYWRYKHTGMASPIQEEALAPFKEGE